MTQRIDPPPWPYPERPRVLIEDPDAERALETATALRGAGYGVAICHGPDDDANCPIVGTHTCAFVDGADAVVCNLGTSARAKEVVDGLRLTRPSTPLLVNIEVEGVVAAVAAAVGRPTRG